MDTRVANECYACDEPIELMGTDDMGMCDSCLGAWWRHAADEHECSWGCLADFTSYEPKGVGDE